MEILYKNETEDYGNDCMIYESILLFREFGDLKIRHSKRYRGGGVDDTPRQSEITLGRSLKNLQEELDEFFNDNSINKSLKFSINKYLD